MDNAATTNIDKEVIEAMNSAFALFGNPSSLHNFGQKAKSLVDKSRETVAEFLNCKPTEVIFTSGGSEADNLAIKGVIDAFYSNLQFSIYNFQSITNYQISNFKKPHVITTMIEHHAVLHTVQDLEKEGKIEATYIKPGKNGVVLVSDVEAAIKPNTILVSVMYVNNETGCMEPVREIGKMIERLNKNRDGKIYLHTDAVQAAEYLPMDTKHLHVDLLTMTAHKIHGPKGIGVLFAQKGTPVLAQITGGDHEFGLRAGTENVVGIAGLAEAIESIRNTDNKIQQVVKLRDKLECTILKTIPDTFLNGDKELRAPHISNISFKNAEGEAIILNLDFLGIAVSSGSACTARSLESSHVLTAMDLPHELSHGAIRFSLSKYTTEEEIDRICEVMPGVIAKLRQMSPFA